MGPLKKSKATAGSPADRRKPLASGVHINNTKTIKNELKRLTSERTMPKSKPKGLEECGIAELDGTTSKIPDDFRCNNYLFLFLRKGEISLVGMERALQGKIKISKRSKKFRRLLSQTGLILGIALPAHPHFHFLKYLSIRIHGVAQMGRKAFRVIETSALSKAIPMYFVTENENFISKGLGLAVLNDPVEAGIPLETIQSLIKAEATRLVLQDRKAAKLDKKRNLRQSHITLSSLNQKDEYGYGGQPTNAAMSVPRVARDDLYSMSETMMEVMRDFCEKHLGETIYHNHVRNRSGCLALSRAAFGRPGHRRRGLHESLTLSQSRLFGGKAGDATLAFHVDRLNDWRRGYCVSGSFSFAVRGDDGKSIDRLTFIAYTRKFIGDKLLGPMVDYAPP